MTRSDPQAIEALISDITARFQPNSLACKSKLRMAIMARISSLPHCRNSYF